MRHKNGFYDDVLYIIHKFYIHNNTQNIDRYTAKRFSIEQKYTNLLRQEVLYEH